MNSSLWCNLMLEQLFEIFKLSVSGIISLLTTYIVLMRQNKQKEISEGITFYRSILPHILPILKSVSNLESAKHTLKVAIDKIIEGQKGFPAMHASEDMGVKYLKEKELRDLITVESDKLQALCSSQWLTILPAILTIPIEQIWCLMYQISQSDWTGEPKKTHKIIMKISELFTKYHIAVYKLLGLTSTYRHICKDAPINYESLKEILETDFGDS